MNTQLAVANLFFLSIGALVMSMIVAMRAYDMWQRGRYDRVTTHGGVSLFLAALSCEAFYWFLHWLLLADGDLVASRWYVDNARVTLAFGALATVGVSLTTGTLLWRQVGLIGALVATTGVLSVWFVGFSI